MSKIVIIATGSFKDILRKKILYLILLIAVLCLFGAHFLTFFKESVQIRLMKDLAFGIITLFCAVVAVLAAMELIPDEVESRSVYYLLSRPVHRWQYVTGKFLALAAILLLNIILVGGAFIVMIYIKKQLIPENAFVAMFFIYLKSLIVASITMALSTCVSRIINVSLVLLMYCVATFKTLLIYAFQKMELPVLSIFLNIVKHLLPSFEYLAIGDAIVHNFQVPWTYIIGMTAYTLGYVTACCGIALLFFSGKDL